MNLLLGGELSHRPSVGLQVVVERSIDVSQTCLIKHWSNAVGAQGYRHLYFGAIRKKIHTMGAMGDDCRGPGK